MAQLRHDYPKFKALNAEVLVVVPNGPKMIERHVSKFAPPYPILSDKGSQVTEQYHVDTRRTIPALTVFKPSVFLVNMSGEICYTLYSTSYISEPDNQEALAILARLAG